MLSLIGVLVVIVGFALKLDSILIIIVASAVTALCGGLSVGEFLETFGSTFIANRSMNIFIVTMLLTGTLERNGLKSAAADLIKKVKGVSAGVVIAIYTVFRFITAAFNINFGGVAGFIRPVLMPMTVGAVTGKGHKMTEEYEDGLKCACSACENVAWFFGQMLFVGGGAGLLIQSTLANSGYEVGLMEIAKAQLPVAAFAAVMCCVYLIIVDKRMYTKAYGKEVSVK
ncbi:MAG: DUF969 domain-containing protein [Clostridium sp.]|uniref:5-oxoproline transporter, DUF969 family subunit n=1 Tax=Clostridium sp. TaxID=1506 RepID=UPI002A889ED9|nr:DUF969 domain-containing protein [Clostridium sp.]MDY5097139.1 DUF969 family protein [Clostridium sp.]